MMQGSFRSLLSGLLLSPLVLSGQVYFQQQVDHTIAVSLDDERHLLHGVSNFRYTNNSPSTLDTVWIHLWPNAYRDKHSALCAQLDRTGDLDLHFAKEEERGWIDSLDFSVDGEQAAWGYHSEHADIGWVILPKPLVPSASATIATPFRVKIPDGKFSRLGHTGQAYYITQWYPKPAVFDAEGWHAMPYLTLGEFFSEYGSFDVTITLPSNYVVGATGRLTGSPEESAFMNERADLPIEENKANTFPPSSASTKTIRFTQDQVHDFAWFADKRFIVRKSEVALPKNGRTVTTWALFTPKNAKLWADAVSYVNESVRMYSQWVGDYPYDACTALDGTISAGGGMEYPMITIIGNMSSAESLDNVIAHEVGHNWFYGILGSNERDHAWMDEGMNSFVELRYMRERYPNSGFGFGIPGMKGLTKRIRDPHHFQSELGYRLNARRNLDQAPCLHANEFTEINYGTMVYMKTALIMDHLMAYLGEETMDKCMHAYYEEWKFKHPQPGDMRKVFERECGKDLRWVFDELIGTGHKVDPKVLKLRGGSLTYRTNTTAPFAIKAWSAGDSLGTIWSNVTDVKWWRPKRKKDWVLSEDFEKRAEALRGPDGKGTIELPWPNADRIVIDAGNRTLDIDRRNNEVRSHGLFKRYKAPAFEPFLGIERDDRRSVYYAPAIAWNGHDGFQAGMVLRNTTFPSQRTEWVVAPVYGFGSGRFAGAGRIEHHFDRMRSQLFQQITLGLSGRTSTTAYDPSITSWYSKLSPYLHFDLLQPSLNRPWKHSIELRSVWIKNSSKATTEPSTASIERTYGEIRYRAASHSALWPASISPLFTFTPEFSRLSIELEQGFTYNARKDQFRLHAFAGTFISKSEAFYTNALNAWQLTWGPEDLLYDHAYLERGSNVGVTGAQFVKQQGAFKTPFSQGGSEGWIAALNAEIDLPLGPLPLTLFASIGAVPVFEVNSSQRRERIEPYTEGGLGIQLVRDRIEVWFPLVVSQNILDEEEFLGRSVSDRIRFVFALEKFDPTRMLRGLKP